MTSQLTTIIVISMALFGASSAGIVPAAVAAPAPLVAAAPAPIVAAPLAVGYTKAVPHNVPPHASRVDISTRTLAAQLVAAPAIAPAVAPAIAPGIAPAFAPAVAPAALTYNPYNPYVYPANLAAPFVQPAILG